MMLGFVARRPLAPAAAIAVATSVLWIACDDGSNPVKEARVGADSGTAADSGPPPDVGRDAQTEAGPTDCVQDPKTHLEIINACTNATKISKNPTLPKLLPDGGLPPLL